MQKMIRKFQQKPEGYGDWKLRYGEGRWGKPFSPASAAIWDRYNDPHPGDNYRHLMAGHTEQTISNLELLAWESVEHVPLPREIREERWEGLNTFVNFEHPDAPPRHGAGTRRSSTLQGYEVASAAVAKSRCHLHDGALPDTRMPVTIAGVSQEPVTFAKHGTP